VDRKKFVLLSTIICILTYLICHYALALTPEQIVQKVEANYQKMKTAECDITLDAGLTVFGCGGINQWQGKLYYKYPKKMKFTLNGETYFVKGNDIRKIDHKGKKYYVTLVHAPDFSSGYHPQLMATNFFLTIAKETTAEVILEGIPKPGVLKNARKVYFTIDKDLWLLRQIYVTFDNKNLSGAMTIDYNKINNLWVPVALRGKSAVEIGGSNLVGLRLNLRGEKVTVNHVLPDQLFEAGF